MDWLEDFERRFGENEALRRLKEEGFHGKLELNLADGIVKNVKKVESLRPTADTRIESRVD